MNLLRTSYNKMRKKIYIYLFLIFTLIPLILAGQMDEEDTYITTGIIGELFFEQGTGFIGLSDMILDSTVGRVFSDDVNVRVSFFGQRFLYDMFGAPIAFGYDFFRYYYRRTSENVAEVYLDRIQTGIPNIKDILYGLGMRAIGINFPLYGLDHQIIGGVYLPLFFTHYTFKKLKLVGIRWDMALEGDGRASAIEKRRKKGKTGVLKRIRKAGAEMDLRYNKEEIFTGKLFEFKSFFTTRFQNDSNYEFNKKQGLQDKDKLLTALRARVDLGGISSHIPDIFKGQYLGASVVIQNLRNELYSDSGFPDGVSAEYDTGDTIIHQARLFGGDLVGYIKSFMYYLEYAHADQYKHDVVEVGGAKKIRNSQRTSDHAAVINITSEDILEDLKQPKFSIGLEAWDIGSEYNAGWAVDDDDDKDRFLDESLQYHDQYFPYQTGKNRDKRYNEPQAGVIPIAFNRNENAIPDYNEAFLMFYADRFFLGSMVFEDANYNGILDYEENDDDPDFPYDRNRQGYRGVFGVTPFDYDYGTFFAGVSYNKKVSPVSTAVKYETNGSTVTTNVVTVRTTNISSSSYLFGYRLNKEFKDSFRLTTEFLFERVHDRIEDNYIGLKSYRQTYDTLLYSDNSLYKIQLKLWYIRIKNLTAAVKIRQTYNIRHSDNMFNKFSRQVLKIGYDYSFTRLPELVISPQFKYVLAKNLFFQEEFKEVKVTDDSLISDQFEKFNAKYYGFKAKYSFTENMYILGGIQLKSLNDKYFPENSSENMIYGAQIVFSGQSMKVGKKGGGGDGKPISFTAGYKISQTHYIVDDYTYKEETFFANFIVTL